MNSIPPIWEYRIKEGIKFILRILFLPIWFCWHLADELIKEAKENELQNDELWEEK